MQIGLECFGVSKRGSHACEAYIVPSLIEAAQWACFRVLQRSSARFIEVGGLRMNSHHGRSYVEEVALHYDCMYNKRFVLVQQVMRTDARDMCN